MIRSFIINKYVSKEFLKTVINITFVLFCFSFILNFFEEINFFKDLKVNIIIPFYLSLLFVPSLIFSMFPFIILLSGIWFFMKIKKNDEIIGMKASGMSNLSIITIPGILSLLLGVFMILAFNPLASTLVKNYESIKGKYEKKQDYLAAVTVNGIWIKEKRLDKNFIIRSENLKNNSLINLTIYEFDNNYNFIKRIESEIAEIISKDWKLKNSKIIDKDGKIIEENVKTLSYISQYDVKKIKSLYSNLDTISFWNLNKEIKVLEERGYSTGEMRAKLHRSFAFPFFLLSMVLLSGVFTLGTKVKESNWHYIFVAILASVLIFYLNDFSAALGKTDKLSVEVSVWMPIFIIFIFSSVGVLHANQK